MRIKVNPYPAMYYSVICEEHNCRVNVRHFDEPNPRGGLPSSGRIHVVGCASGGQQQEMRCNDSWVMTISGGGDVTITN